MKTLQKFAAVHGPAHNHFRRYRTSAATERVSQSLHYLDRAGAHVDMTMTLT